MILFVAGGWLLRSKPMCDWNAKRQRISRGKEALMARIIEFYVPAKFQRRKPLIAQSQKGKVVVFCAEAKKPAQPSKSQFYATQKLRVQCHMDRGGLIAIVPTLMGR